MNKKLSVHKYFQFSYDYQIILLLDVTDLLTTIMSKFPKVVEQSKNKLHNFLTGWPKNLETWNNLEFDNLGKKKPGI